MVNRMSSRLLTPWRPTNEAGSGSIANMATRIGQGRRAHLYIDEWFEERGLNDTKVGERLGLHRSTIFKWRGNPSRLDPEKMAALAEALDIEITQLYRPPAEISLDEIAKDFTSDMKQTAADIVMRLGKTGT